MANSKYEYVKHFEQSPRLLPNTYIVVRLDGRGFHKLSSKYGFQKPNDLTALALMNACAQAVMHEISDIQFGYGVSDEYSFILHRSTGLFGRRESKILTTIVSTFSSYFVALWPLHFEAIQLTPPMPSFDGRVILYPDKESLLDYIRWRQVDCHINNLYNTTFWTLVSQGHMTNREAETKLKGTLSADKHELLFSKFNINYNKEPDIFKKGTIVFRALPQTGQNSPSEPQADSLLGTTNSELIKSESQAPKVHQQSSLRVDHCDLIKDPFWELNQHLL